MTDAFGKVLDDLVERYNATNNTLSMAICRSMARLLCSEALTASDASAVNALAELLPKPAGPMGLDLSKLSDLQLTWLEEIMDAGGAPEKSDIEDVADLEQQVVSAREEAIRVIADKKVLSDQRDVDRQEIQMLKRLGESSAARISELQSENHDLKEQVAAAVAAIAPAVVPAEPEPPLRHNIIPMSPFNHGR